ncbi:TPA: GPO family capsid scaffolding protein [Enterobacter ludwigii]|nr:GPO family capsid scaffolding protein [Enterobacter ludwigii]HDR2591125.1 GPO family capsid scaffolding protein [Enterobacter ludwigii]
MNIKPFWILIARDGETVDGRYISAKALQEMADSYSLDYYTAYAYQDDYRGPRTMPIGLMLAAKTELQGKDTCLYVLFEPSEHWSIALSEFELKDIPVYPALEYLPLMANSAEPYITGMFLTTSPAIRNLDPLNKHMVKE